MSTERAQSPKQERLDALPFEEKRQDKEKKRRKKIIDVFFFRSSLPSLPLSLVKSLALRRQGADSDETQRL